MGQKQKLINWVLEHSKIFTEELKDEIIQQFEEWKENTLIDSEIKMLTELIDREIQVCYDIFNRTNNPYWMEKIDKLNRIKGKL